MEYCYWRLIGCLGQEDTFYGLHSQFISMKKLSRSSGKVWSENSPNVISSRSFEICSFILHFVFDFHLGDHEFQILGI